jgi:hypothetical protein
MSPGTETLILEIQTRRGVTIPRRGDYLDALAMCQVYGKRFEDWLLDNDREDYRTSPNPNVCVTCEGTTWLISHEAMSLLYWLDVGFALDLCRTISHLLRRDPAREHHQASMAAAAPKVYEMMFPDVPA